MACIAGGRAQRINHILDFPSRLRIYRAAFFDQHIADFVGPPRNHVDGAQQEHLAFRNHRAAPAFRRPVRRLDGALDFLRAGLLGPCKYFSGGRIDVVSELVS
jgi:hypothetical protein